MHKASSPLPTFPGELRVCARLRNYTEEPFCPPSTFFSPASYRNNGHHRIARPSRKKKGVMRALPPCGIGNLRCYALRIVTGGLIPLVTKLNLHGSAAYVSPSFVTIQSCK